MTDTNATDDTTPSTPPDQSIKGDDPGQEKGHSIALCSLAALGVFLAIWLLPFGAIFGVIGAILGSAASLVLQDPRFFIGLSLAGFVFSFCAGNRQEATQRQSLVFLVMVAISCVALGFCLLVPLVYADRAPDRQDYNRLMNTPPAQWTPSRASGYVAGNLQRNGVASINNNRRNCVEMAGWNVQSKYYRISLNGQPSITPENCNKGLNAWKWERLDAPLQ